MNIWRDMADPPERDDPEPDPAGVAAAIANEREFNALLEQLDGLTTPTERDGRLIVSPATEIALLRAELARVTAERDRALAVADAAVAHAAAEIAAVRSEALAVKRGDPGDWKPEVDALWGVEDWLSADGYDRALAFDGTDWIAYENDDDGTPGPTPGSPAARSRPMRATLRSVH